MISDYQNDFSLGQNNGVSPFLSRSSYYEGVNVHARSGYLQSREADVEVKISEDLTGRYQGAASYNPGTGDRLIMVVGGIVYEVWGNGKALKLTDERLLSDKVDRCSFVQANRFLIIQDGINPPVVIDESSIGNSDTIPIGRWMVSGNGYLCVVTPDLESIKISNISTFLDDQSEILKFTDIPQTLRPSDIGKIVGLKMAPILDAGTNMGSLLAFGSKGIVFAYDLTVPRDEWGNTAGFGRKIAENLFVSSNESIQAIGGDLFMRTSTGIDTLNLARSDWQASRNRSISQPVDGWLERDAEHLLRLCSSVVWGDRYYFTVKPFVRFDTPEVIHEGVCVYDVRHGLESSPAFPGIESGIYPSSLHVIDNAMVIVGKGKEGGVRMWRRIRQGGCRQCSPSWSVITRAFDWDMPHKAKSLKGGQSYINIEFAEPGEVVVEFRVDGTPNWRPLTVLKTQSIPGVILQSHAANMGLPGLPEFREGDFNRGFTFNWLQLRISGNVAVKIRAIHLLAVPSDHTFALDPGRVSTYVTQETF